MSFAELGNLFGGVTRTIGSFLDRDHAESRQDEIWNRNAALQREFAQSGIQWKVADARKAGIHPVYALGGQTHAASPIAVGDTPGIGASMAEMGQDISRAFNATRSSGARQTAFDETVQKLTLQKMGLENDLLASQIKRLQVNSNPPLPIPEGKADDRPPLHVGGQRWSTDPTTSNVEDFSKRYGDEGPAQWLAQALVAWNDYKANSGSFDTRPEAISQKIWDAMKWIDRNVKVFPDSSPIHPNRFGRR